MNIVLDVLMIDHPTDISKYCHQTSQIFAQVAVVLNLTGQSGPQNGRYFTGLKLENYYFFTFTFFRPEVRKLLLFYFYFFSTWS